MSLIPSVLSPARVTQALASVGPPAGSGGLRISSTDPVTPGNTADVQRSSVSRTRSPSRVAATALPATAGRPSSPFSTDASPIATAPSPIAPSPAAIAAAADSSTSGSLSGGAAGAAAYPDRGSGSGTGEPSSAATSARSLNGRRLPATKSFRSRPDSAKASGGGRVLLGHESSANSLSTPPGGYGGSGTGGGGGGGLSSPGQRSVYMSNALSARGSRGGGLGRDRSYAGSVSSATGQFRPLQGSINGGFMDAMSSALGGLTRGGGPVGLQPAPGTVGGIDVARLAAIQRLLDEFDSDEASDPTATVSPRGEGSSYYRRRSDSHAGDGAAMRHHRGSDSESGTGSGSGMRTVASLRSRKDMLNWQPSMSAMRGSLEEHQQRLRERADVTQHLKKWAEQVLEDARRGAASSASGRGSDISRAASVRFKDIPEDRSSSPTTAAAAVSPEEEFLDPEQELDDEEERRLESLRVLPPNPRGLGTQLRAHFTAVVEDEVNKKLDVMRTKWEAEKGLEAEELRALRESYRDLRRAHMETKEALEKANTRMDVMRLQMKATAAFNKAGREGGTADGDGSAGASKGAGGRGHRSSTHDGGEGKGKGGKGGSGGITTAHSTDTGSVSAAHGVDDELHDKLKSIGSRRPTSPIGDGSGANAEAILELQERLQAHADTVATLNRKLQEADQQLAKLKLDKASLEHQLGSARERASSPDPDGAAVQISKLKQERAALEQQLAAAKGAKPSSGKGGAAKGSPVPAKGGGSGRAATGGPSGGKGVPAAGVGGKVAELMADVERLQIELAASKREAASSSKEAMTRRMELQKAKDDLSAMQSTLDVALQQVATVKDATAQEKARADRAAAALEAAEAAQAQAQASAAAANSAAAMALIKRSAATDEVQELLARLGQERDAAVKAANELRQQVQEMSKSLSERTAEVMQLRDQLLRRQMESKEPSSPYPAAAAEAAPPEAVAPERTAPERAVIMRAPGQAAAGGVGTNIQSKVTAAAVAAMQSLGLTLRPVPPAARRRPTSALAPSGAITAGLDSAVGVAAAAAAAAALVPAVLEVLQQRVPDMVMTLEGELEAASASAAAAAAAAEPAPASDGPGAHGGSAAAANAAAAAAAAAAATLRESGNAASAAAAGATAAAPIIVSTFVDLVRAELLHGGCAPETAAAAADSGAASGPATDAAERSGGEPARTTRPETIITGETVSEQLDRLSALSSDRLYVFQNGAVPTVLPTAAATTATASAGGGGSGSVPTVSFADDGAVSAASASAAAAAAASPVSGLRSAPPSAVVVDGVTFYPLGLRETPKGSRRTGPLATILSGGHELPPSPQRLPPPPPLPHHTPYFEAAAAAVVAAAADLLPQTVSVPIHTIRRSLVSDAVAAAARRRRANFAQLHSSYFTTPPPPPGAAMPDPNALPTMAEMPEEEFSDDAAALAAGAAGNGNSNGDRYSARMIRSAGPVRDVVDGAAQDAYGSVYVDPELASVLHVGRVSPATARAAGAGRGAISPEALGPSLRDRALAVLQAPEPLPPPHQRPQSAAVRTVEAARQFIAQHGGIGGRHGQPLRPCSAALPPVAGTAPAGAAAAESLAPAPAEGAAGGAQLTQPDAAMMTSSPGVLPVGVKVRTITANPQKGVQLAVRMRGPRQQSARGVNGKAQMEGGVRFKDEEDAAAAGGAASVSTRLVPGLGLGPPMREVQLHVGLPGAAVGTVLVSGDAGGGGSGDEAVSELPSSGPELAALARELMVAQERAARELEEAMSTRRELAEEVVTSRQQWLEEARRARALEKELEGVRSMMFSIGIGSVPPGPTGGRGFSGLAAAVPSISSNNVTTSGAASAPTTRRSAGST